MALTAGTASAMPVCVTLREARRRTVQAASESFGNYTTAVLEQDDDAAYEWLSNYQSYIRQVSYDQGVLDQAGC